jgi:hypothetical protein
MHNFLRRIARRCEIHDRAWPLLIRELETDLGYQPSAGPASLAESYGNPRLIDCGHQWCGSRRKAPAASHRSGGYSPVPTGVRPGIPPQQPAGASPPHRPA